MTAFPVCFKAAIVIKGSGKAKVLALCIKGTLTTLHIVADIKSLIGVDYRMALFLKRQRALRV